MKQFEDKFMEVQASMISLASEYVRAQAEKIFIYAIADSLYSFNVFYKVCGEYHREHPTEMWLVYDAETNSLKSKYSYEGRYDKDEELLPRKEFEKWFEEVKESQE